MSSGKDAFLGKEPVRKLILKLSIPAMVAMLVNALYNVVDTIFVGRGVGSFAIGGLAIVFPIQIMVMALAMMFGIGSASIVSRALGAGEREKAADTVGNGMILGFLFGVLICIAGYLFMDPLLLFFGATETLLPYAKSYMSYILPGSIFLSVAMVSNNIIRAEGRALVSMSVMLTGAISNILLDPLFIFVLKMGIRGAAIATVISQFLAFSLAIWFFFVGKKSIHHLRPHNFILKARIVRETIIIGFPAFVRQFAGSFLMILVNNALKTSGGAKGDFYISAFGVVNRILTFGLMPLFGISQGFQPIAGYNYGAKKYNRVKESIWVSLGISALLSLLFFLVTMIFAEKILWVFSTDTELIEIGVTALRTIVLIVPIIGVQVVGATYFQAVGKAFPALILSLSRQVILLIPLLIILPPLLGVRGVWISFPIADLLSTALTGFWLYLQIKKLDEAHASIVQKKKEDLGIETAISASSSGE